MKLSLMLAQWLAPKAFKDLDDQIKACAKHKADMQLEVNRRVADVLLQMDPFEPFLKKYNVVFSEEWANPEDKLDEQSKVRMFMWASGTMNDPSFKHMTDWIINTQGNNTLRKGRNDYEWFFGRAAIITMDLFVREVGRLASRYNEIIKKGPEFDARLTVE